MPPPETDVCSPCLSIQSSLLNNENTDLLIECDNGKQSFRVHKAVVLPQCQFFKNSCKEWVMKKDCKDGNITYIELPDDSAIAVDAAIEFFYDKRYSNGNTTSSLAVPKSDHVKSAWKASEIRCHVQVYIMAEKYNLKELLTFASNKVIYGLSTSNLLPEFHDVIRDVYNNTPSIDSLRVGVSKFASCHGKEEFAISGKKFGDLIVELPEFGRDLVKYLCRSKLKISPNKVSMSNSDRRKRSDGDGVSSSSSSSSDPDSSGSSDSDEMDVEGF
ncbi:hypothetical protein Vi05172_g6174 [Venturia inaequalis]|nr:hypothetical protein Vi05172_g6174 [Venturia inaequalis]